MVDITSLKNAPLGVVTSQSQTPGAPARRTSGPNHPPTLWDDVKVEGVRRLGDVSNEELRAMLARRNIEGAHVDGRATLAERWAKRIADIRKAAADKAEADYLAQEG